VRLVRLVSQFLKPAVRLLLEKFVLLNACLSLCLLVYLHNVYVNSPMTARSNCLFEQLSVQDRLASITDYDVIKLYISDTKFNIPDGLNMPDISELDNTVRCDGIDMKQCRSDSAKEGSKDNSVEWIDKGILKEHTYDPNHTTVNTAPYFSRNEEKLYTKGKGSKDKLHDHERVYLFSLEKGYLMLRPEERDRHDIRRLDLTIPMSGQCLGAPLSAWMVRSFIGYDTVVMNWAISTFGGRGYLYNTYSKDLFNLNFAADFMDNIKSTKKDTTASEKGLKTKFEKKTEDQEEITEKKTEKKLDEKLKNPNEIENNIINDKIQNIFDYLILLTLRTRGGKIVEFTFNGLRHFIAFKMGVIFSTLFLFFTTTTLVSFTLRETQERMLKFTFLLQHHVSHGIPYAPLVFTHVVESLVFVPIMVGILFFLFEFFSDQLLAFMVLSVVWLSEVFSVISLRSSSSIRFFPRVFFLYFFLFHLYFFSFPYGFSYLALFTTVLFVNHSMLFCWNTYEIPALESGLITALNPRVGMRIASGLNQAPPPSINSLNTQNPVLFPSIITPNQTSVVSPVTLAPNEISVSSPRDAGIGNEAFIRHVALSRRIQQEQLSVMLGIRVPPPSFVPSSSSGGSSSPRSMHERNSIDNTNNNDHQGGYQNRGNHQNNNINQSSNHNYNADQSNNDDNNDDNGRIRMVSYPFPMSVVASVGRALDSGFGWTISRSNGIEVRDRTSARTENVITDTGITEDSGNIARTTSTGAQDLSLEPVPQSHESGGRGGSQSHESGDSSDKRSPPSPNARRSVPRSSPSPGRSAPRSPPSANARRSAVLDFNDKDRLGRERSASLSPSRSPPRPSLLPMLSQKSASITGGLPQGAFSPPRKGAGVLPQCTPPRKGAGTLSLKKDTLSEKKENLKEKCVDDVYDEELSDSVDITLGACLSPNKSKYLLSNNKQFRVFGNDFND